LGWSGEAQAVRCVCLDHLLHIVVVVLLRTEWPEWLFLRHRECIIIVKTIEIIEHRLHRLSIPNRYRIYFLYGLDIHRYLDLVCCRLLFLDARLIHGLLKHLPCILVFLG
jgi:hypothetical protein